MSLEGTKVKGNLKVKVKVKSHKGRATF